MPNKIFNRTFFELLFLALIVLISRIPFLLAGFGAEEDSWLLAITSKNIAESGQYEMSRAPGHPLQEFIYAWMYNNGLLAFATNLLSAAASVIATIFFALSLKNLYFKHYLFAAFAFAFTPIVFISSTYTIDYMLAMAFVMMSFYFLTSPLNPLSTWRGENLPPGKAGGKGVVWGEVIAGIFLGIAIGFRITSGAMLIPFCILLLPLSKGILRAILLFSLTTALTGLLIYIPVLKTYGLSFFTYADQFPYPNLPKVIYKATIGVFGTIGIITIIVYTIKIAVRKFLSKEKIVVSEMPAELFWASVGVIIIYIIFYLRLPQKPAYFIPVIPFTILLFGYFLTSRGFKTFCVLMTMSSFLFSINLTDSLRGSAHSRLAMKFTAAGQEMFIDPLTGPVFADHTKRLNKIAFTEKVFQKTRVEQKKIVLICGWWYNELLVRNWNCKQNQNVVMVFYIDKSAMASYISDGYEIFYLPEQNLYNDQYSNMHYTDSVAKPYM